MFCALLKLNRFPSNLVDFPFFPERRIILSVGVRFPGEFDANASEAEIRDLCISDAREFLTNFKNKAEFFNVTRKQPDAVIEKSSGDASMLNADFEGIGTNSGLLKVGQMDDGGYAVVVGGIVVRLSNLQSQIESETDQQKRDVLLGRQNKLLGIISGLGIGVNSNDPKLLTKLRSISNGKSK